MTRFRKLFVVNVPSVIIHLWLLWSVLVVSRDKPILTKTHRLHVLCVLLENTPELNRQVVQFVRSEASTMMKIQGLPVHQHHEQTVSRAIIFRFNIPKFQKLIPCVLPRTLSVEISQNISTLLQFPLQRLRAKL
jgi:hypothetical protein